MSSVDPANGTLELRIFYYGPGGSGTTTNLEALAERLPTNATAGLTRVETDGEGALPYEALPIDLGEVAEARARVVLRTVPAERAGHEARGRRLDGIDGVVFVADAARHRQRANAEALRELREALAEEGVRLADLPLVLQVNRSDLPEALPVDQVRQVLDPDGERMTVEAVATRFEGVVEPLREVARRVLERLATPA